MLQALINPGNTYSIIASISFTKAEKIVDSIRNSFKRGLLERRQQIGLWCCLPDAYSTEVIAGSGFDWIVLDTEHTPADPLTVLAQLQAVQPYPVSAVVRPVNDDIALIKRHLDLGAQTLMIPYVQTAEQAKTIVSAMRYAPRGVRGMAGITRATRYGRVPEYATRAEEELCLIVQVETVEAIEQLEKICAVDGVDAVFIGPADLAASMGYPGQPGHPEVVSKIEQTIKKLKELDKPAGILTTDTEFAKRCIELGTTFTAVGLDIHLLVTGADKLAGQFGRKLEAVAR